MFGAVISLWHRLVLIGPIITCLVAIDWSMASDDIFAGVVSGAVNHKGESGQSEIERAA